MVEGAVALSPEDQHIAASKKSGDVMYYYNLAKRMSKIGSWRSHQDADFYEKQSIVKKELW